LAGATTLGLVLVLGVFDPEARYLVPVGGMVIGNAMTAAAVALNRLGDDVADSASEIEATLALGATSAQAIRPVVRRSLRSGMIPLIDSTKTTGLIFFPGTMVGMLLAGAAPVDAVRLQLVLLYVLLGSVAVGALTSVLLAYRNFFTPAQQLRELPA
jgi:putative ABC transport system permease protein